VDSVFNQFPTRHNASTPREICVKLPPRPPPPTPLRKYFHDYSGIRGKGSLYIYEEVCWNPDRTVMNENSI
jgi:hypothetical protein